MSLLTGQPTISKVRMRKKRKSRAKKLSDLTPEELKRRRRKIFVEELLVELVQLIKLVYLNHPTKRTIFANSRKMMLLQSQESVRPVTRDRKICDLSAFLGDFLDALLSTDSVKCSNFLGDSRVKTYVLE